jgi:hypothetical protein
MRQLQEQHHPLLDPPLEREEKKEGRSRRPIAALLRLSNQLLRAYAAINVALLLQSLGPAVPNTRTCTM